MSSDAPALPELSNSQRKKLAAQAHNARLAAATPLPKKLKCPMCRTEFEAVIQNGRLTKIGRDIDCPGCPHVFNFARYRA